MKRLLIIAILAFAAAVEAFAALNVTSLRVNRLDNPCGVDPGGRLSFSWMLSSDRPSTVQTAYEIEVRAEGTSVWKSGKVLSDNCLDIPCPVGMQSGVQYDWYLKVWDNFGRVSARAHGRWLTGLEAAEWKASWLEAPADGRAVYFRRGISVDRKIARATAFISAKGIYQAAINDVKIGDDLLTPGWTAYDKRIQYQAYDVTPLLARGHNEIRAEVSQGWYSGGLNWGKASKRFRYGRQVAFLMQLKLEYSDGSSEILCTDKSWEQSYGPVQFANIYDGQTTDFNVPFSWSGVSDVKALDASTLASSVSEPVRRREALRPLRLIKTPAGESVIDFGQNLTGWERVRLCGHKGDTVRISHAEILDNDGNFYTANLRDAKATSTIVLSGGEDVFEPVHTFYGFRYIRIEGLKGEIDLSRFEAVPISSSFDDCGSFECSDSLINRLQHNILWSFRDNFVDVPTDCPQRDERLGWTGDAQVFFRTATFLGRVENFFRKWLRDLSLDQRADGGVPRVIPDTHPKSNYHVGATGWADCATLIPWQHYMAYGDLSILEDQYPCMKAWVDYCIRQAEPNGWLRNTGLENHYGDWLFYSKKNDPDGQSAVTSKALIAQAFFAESARILASAARLTGREDDANHYDEVYGKVVQAFRNEYVTPSGRLMSDTQTAYVLALHFNLMPDSLRQAAVGYLVENIHRYNDHITTGFLGTPYICQVLTDNGRPDVAYTLLMQDSCPSWIYPALHGATTIWERWDSLSPDGTIIGGMNSFNHYSFGAIGDWLYRSALGICETRPGYRTMEINPHAGGGITSMKGGKMTPYGLVQVEWTADRNGVISSLSVTVPAGTSARIHFQGRSYDVGSGTYHYCAAAFHLQVPDRERTIDRYVSEFNADDEELYVQTFPNSSAAQFLKDNIPIFDCPDSSLCRTYYFRWWTFRKHIKTTPEGYVISEFLPDVRWAGKYNTISCAAMHHFAEGRWLRNSGYLEDYARFWFCGSGSPRKYSFPAADALLKFCSVHPDSRLLADLYAPLKRNCGKWDSHRDSTGLYWQSDDRDGMELSISGFLSQDHTGYRPTINSYMYAEFRALASIAQMLGNVSDKEYYTARADTLKGLIDAKLWDNDARFYKVIPRNGSFTLSPVRELLGYVPWAYGIPDADKTDAWLKLMDEDGFKAPFGPTTAERSAEGFNVSYEGKNCKWDGPSWPFATSQTLSGLADCLRRCGEGTITKDDYMAVLSAYSISHRLQREDGRTVCWIDEDINPFTGDWIVRTRILSSGKGIRERGKDYNHSTFCDLVISDLVGLRPCLDGSVEIQPLIPEGLWNWFCLKDVHCAGHDYDIVYDRTGRHYGAGRGFRVYRDGKLVHHSKSYSVKLKI